MQFSIPLSLLLCSILVDASVLPVPHDKSLRISRSYIPSRLPGVASSALPSDGKALPIHARANTRSKTKKKSTRKHRPAKNPATVRPKVPKTKVKRKLQPWEGPVPTEAQVRRKCKVPKGKSFFYSGTWPKAAEYSRGAGWVMDV